MLPTQDQNNSLSLRILPHEVLLNINAELDRQI